MNRLIVFDSVHHAIRTERLLHEAKIVEEMIPTPREITASCGQSISFNERDLDIVRKILEREKILFRGIYSAANAHRKFELLMR